MRVSLVNMVFALPKAWFAFSLITGVLATHIQAEEFEKFEEGYTLRIPRLMPEDNCDEDDLNTTKSHDLVVYVSVSGRVSVKYSPQCPLSLQSLIKIWTKENNPEESLHNLTRVCSDNFPEAEESGTELTWATLQQLDNDEFEDAAENDFACTPQEVLEKLNIICEMFNRIRETNLVLDEILKFIEQEKDDYKIFIFNETSARVAAITREHTRKLEEINKDRRITDSVYEKMLGTQQNEIEALNATVDALRKRGVPSVNGSVRKETDQKRIESEDNKLVALCQEHSNLMPNLYKVLIDNSCFEDSQQYWSFIVNLCTFVAQAKDATLVERSTTKEGDVIELLGTTFIESAIKKHPERISAVKDFFQKTGLLFRVTNRDQKRGVVIWNRTQ